ncbi:hypothetical protein SDC9_137518 [bioreactor metagenome]|uniref:Uncharacterized protein n=1 Tax=bioreactor metagenome TaxID=1076179 RepID=A0A645DM81_9ZZZZ
MDFIAVNFRHGHGNLPVVNENALTCRNIPRKPGIADMGMLVVAGSIGRCQGIFLPLGEGGGLFKYAEAHLWPLSVD